LDEQVPRADIAGPSPDELCPVPVARLRELVERLEGRSVFAWDHLARGWRPMGRGDVRPGMLALVAADAGGYDPDLGFDPRVTSPVDPIPREPEASAPVAFDNEEANEADGSWVTLDVHAKETAAVAARYARSLLADAAAPSWLPAAVEAAARWHDLGKVHPVFQRAVLVGLPEEERRQREGTVWAKSGHRALRYERRHFRHELVSALLVLELVRQQGPAAVGLPEGADDLALDLVVYLVAAHHGKVRLALRSLPDEHPMASGSDGPAVTIRGVQHGETLPSVTVGGLQLPPIPLDLSISEVGLSDDGQPSWLERSLRLRDRFGPFRLGFLEALVRLADWEASAGGPRSEGELHA
jgi:CRISPR-associated endonuclease/helicase Cas3